MMPSQACLVFLRFPPILCGGGAVTISDDKTLGQRICREDGWRESCAVVVYISFAPSVELTPVRYRTDFAVLTSHSTKHINIYNGFRRTTRAVSHARTLSEGRGELLTHIAGSGWAALLPISMLRPLKAPSTSTTSLATSGLFCSRIQKTSLLFAPPNSAPSQSSNQNSQEEVSS